MNLPPNVAAWRDALLCERCTTGAHSPQVHLLIHQRATCDHRFGYACLPVNQESPCLN